MNLQEEIAKVARDLYEKSGCLTGRDRENWFDAERIVLLRHASQDMEEPEGEEPLVEEKTITEEVEGTELKQAGPASEEGSTVMEEVEEKSPFNARKKAARKKGAVKRK